MMKIQELDLYLELSDDFFGWLEATSEINAFDPYLSKTLLDYDQKRLIMMLREAKHKIYDQITERKFKNSKLPQDLEIREEIFHDFFADKMIHNKEWIKLCEFEALLEIALSGDYFIVYEAP